MRWTTRRIRDTQRVSTCCSTVWRLQPEASVSTNYKMLSEKIAARGMTEEGMEQYLSAFKHGMPPHGGLGIGLERLTMKLIGEDNVRETTLFPRDLTRLEP